MIKEMIREDLPTHVKRQAPVAEIGYGLEYQIDSGPILTGQAVPNALLGYPFFHFNVSEDRLVNQIENILLYSFEFPASFPGYELFWRNLYYKATVLLMAAARTTWDTNRTIIKMYIEVYRMLQIMQC